MRAAVTIVLVVSALTCIEGTAKRPTSVQASDPLPVTAEASGCLPDGKGFLRARLRGALNLDLDWHDAEIACSGDARPNGSGLRVSIAGPARGRPGDPSRRIRFVFGLSKVAEGRGAQLVPTNVTLIFEGEQRIFATRGDDKCSSDVVEQSRVGAPGNTARTWRVAARGFCVVPATTLSGDARILLSRFDFAGRAVFN